MTRLTHLNPYRQAMPLFRMASTSSCPTPAHVPPMDIEETDHRYVVTLSVPGYTQEQLQLSVEDNVLHIQGARPPENEGEKDTAGHRYHLRERRMDQFSRTLRLPRDVAGDQIRANCTSGILTLSIPKPEAMQPRRIPISVN